MAFPKFEKHPKEQGDPILSADWNQTVDEIVRLEREKLALAGGTINGSLTVKGALTTGDIELVKDDWAYLDIRASKAGTDAVVRLYDGDDFWSIHHDDSEANQLNVRYNNTTKLALDTDGKLNVRGRLGVGVSSGPQLRVNRWIDMSAHSGGVGLVSGNAFLDDGANVFRFSEDHENLGAVGFATHAPGWHTAGIFVNAPPAEAGKRFEPNWVATFRAKTPLTLGSGKNQDLLKLNSERPWKFAASGSGGNTTLDLRPEVNGKTFRIVSADGTEVPLQVKASNHEAGKSERSWIRFNCGLSLVRESWATFDIRSLKHDAGLRLIDGEKDAAGKDSNYWSIQNDASEGHQLDFRFENSTKLVLQKDGNLGIGTQKPQYALEVKRPLPGALSIGLGGDSGRIRTDYTEASPTLIFYDKDEAGGILRFHESPTTNDENEPEYEAVIAGKRGRIGIGRTSPAARLDVQGGSWDLSNTEGDFRIGSDEHRLKIGVALDGHSAGDVFIRAQGGTNRLSLGSGTEDLLTLRSGTVTVGTDFRVSRGLYIRNSLEMPTFPVPGPKPPWYAALEGRQYANEGQFQPNNIKLRMDSIPFIYPHQPNYEFAIGHAAWTLKYDYQVEIFKKVFWVNQDGEAKASGGFTAGHIMESFINRVGDSIEQGDVVIIGRKATRYSGISNNIPIPEVDLCKKEYDTRVCGIVAKAIGQADLPYVEPEAPKEVAKSKAAQTSQKAKRKAAYRHPLRRYAVKLKEGATPLGVPGGQMGSMVTAGCWAHCKVDADIAPIKVGDLLTTSLTPGHAQKILEKDRAKATGAILGKALAALPKGRGKIPVIVMMQ